MARPEISLDNQAAVYEHYSNHDGSRLALRAAMFASARYYRTDLHYAPGARDRIEEIVENDTRLIFSPNHQIFEDQFAIAAITRLEPFFKGLRGNVFVPAKAGHYRNKYLRTGLDLVGAIPAFRSADLANGGSETDLEQATRSMVAISVNRLAHGNDCLIFSEGTRKTGDATELGPIKKGIGHIATEAYDNGTNVAIVPAGVWFGGDGKTRGRNATVFLGNPIEGPFSMDSGSPHYPMFELRSAMGYCKQQAIRLHALHPRVGMAETEG